MEGDPRLQENKYEKKEKLYRTYCRPYLRTTMLPELRMCFSHLSFSIPLGIKFEFMIFWPSGDGNLYFMFFCPGGVADLYRCFSGPIGMQFVYGYTRINNESI